MAFQAGNTRVPILKCKAFIVLKVRYQLEGLLLPVTFGALRERAVMWIFMTRGAALVESNETEIPRQQGGRIGAWMALRALQLSMSTFKGE